MLCECLKYPSEFMVRSGFEKKINKIGIKKSGGKISGLKLSYIMNSFENSLEKLS